MKKACIIAAVVLLLCLAFSLVSAITVRSTCEQVMGLVEHSILCARHNDPSGAAAALRAAEDAWSRREAFFGVVLRHEEMDQIFTGFSSLREYLRLQDLDDYLASAAEINSSLAHLRDMELPLLHNIL